MKPDSVRLFGSFQKSEEQADGTLKVYGTASSEAVDSQGEIVKASAIQAAMPDYLKFGAVREMHTNSAAGTAIEMSVEKDGTTSFAALIVDPIAIKKIQTKVYKGFSIGGKVTGRDPVNKKTITGLNLTEISLVDRPSNPDSLFAIYKAEGIVTADTAAPDPAALTKEADKPDPIAAAVPTPVADTTGEPAEVKKGMYSLASFASVLSSIASLASDAQYESEYEKDGSAIPAGMRTWLKAGLGIFNSMAVEESAELVESLKPKDSLIINAADTPTDLEKAGARHSASDKKHLQGMHDSSVAMGADCKSEKAAGSDDLAKAALEDTTTQLTKVTAQRDELLAKVATFEAQPVPPKGVTKVVGKEEDGVAVVKEEVVDESPLGLMKKAQSAPRLIKL